MVLDRIRSSLLMQQPCVDLVAHCTAFITHVVNTPGREGAVLLCIEQLTEPLVLLLQRGGTFPWACKALLALLQPGSSCREAAAAAVGAHVNDIVAAMVGTLTESEQQSGSTTPAEDLLSQPLAKGGQHMHGLAASLLCLLLEDPAVGAATADALAENSCTVSMLVGFVGSESGGAKALQCLALLLADARAQEQLLAVDGALEKVALHWEQAPAAAARVLCRMSAHLTVSESRSVTHGLLYHTSCPALHAD